MSQLEQTDSTLSELSNKIDKTMNDLENQLSELANLKKGPDSQMLFFNKIERPMNEIRYKVQQLKKQIEIQNEPASEDDDPSPEDEDKSVKVGTTFSLSKLLEAATSKAGLQLPPFGTGPSVTEKEPNAKCSSNFSFQQTLSSGSIRRTHCMWVIKGLDYIRQKESPRFPKKNKPDEQWFISFQLKKEGNIPYFCFELLYVKEPENNYEINAIMILPDFEYTKAFSFSNSILLRENIKNCYKPWQILGNCYGTLPKEIVAHCFVTEIKTNKMDGQLTCNILSTMASILDDSLYTDMVARTNGKDIPCHKSILAAASPVFKVMLETKMKESIENVLDLTGVHNEVAVQDMLNFIYKEMIPDDEDRVKQLYNVAKMYDLVNYKLIKHGDIIDMTLHQLVSDESAIQDLRDKYRDFADTYDSYVSDSFSDADDAYDYYYN